MILINSRGAGEVKLHDFEALVAEACKPIGKPILFVLVSM